MVVCGRGRRHRRGKGKEPLGTESVDAGGGGEGGIVVERGVALRVLGLGESVYLVWESREKKKRDG